MTETTGPPKGRPKLTPEQRARYNLRARLRTTGKRVEAFAADLEARLTDRSGRYHFGRLPGALLCEWHTRKGTHDRPGLPEQMARIEAEAAGGCAEAVAWLEHYGPLYALCLHMQHERPPKRAADYDPLEWLTQDQRDFLRKEKSSRAEWDEWEGAD